MPPCSQELLMTCIMPSRSGGMDQLGRTRTARRGDRMNSDEVGSEPDDASVSMTLLHMAAGAYVGQAISVAAKLGIADLLEDGPKSPTALAEAAGAHADSV